MIAQAIDTQFDDGASNTGSVRAAAPVTGTAAGTTPDRSQAPRPAAARGGVEGGPFGGPNRGGGIPGPRRRTNNGGPRPGHSGPRRPAPAGTGIGNGGGPRPNWTAERTGPGRDDRDRRPSGNSGHPGPQGGHPGAVRALPGERLARAARRD